MKRNTWDEVSENLAELHSSVCGKYNLKVISLDILWRRFPSQMLTVWTDSSLLLIVKAEKRERN